jgi:hypothetical protein
MITLLRSANQLLRERYFQKKFSTIASTYMTALLLYTLNSNNVQWYQLETDDNRGNEEIAMITKLVSNDNNNNSFKLPSYYISLII